MMLQKLIRRARHFHIQRQEFLSGNIIQNTNRKTSQLSIIASYSIRRYYATTPVIPETKDPDAIMPLLDTNFDLENTTSIAEKYNNLLKTLAQNGRSLQAQRVYDQVFRHHVIQATSETFSQLMLSYINDGKYEDAMGIYYALRDHEDSLSSSMKDVRLNASTYENMICSLCSPHNMESIHNSRNANEGEPIYEYSVQDADSAIYQDIEGDSQPALLTALTLFNDMRHLEIQPTSQMYIAMLKACAEQKDEYILEKIHKLIRMDFYLNPGAQVFIELMNAYYANGNGALVLEIWDMTAEKSKSEHGSKIISIVLKTCLEHGFYSRATSIWSGLQDNKNITVQDFNNYLSCLVRSNEIEKANTLLEQGLIDGLADKSSVNIVKKE